MSLLWPDRLHIVLSPNGAAIADQATDFSQNNSTQEASIITRYNATPNWQLASVSLEKLLATKNVKPNTRLSIILSNDFVRYVFLPAQQVAMNSTEKMVYALAAYKQIYGENISSWKVKLHEIGFKQAIVTAAIEEIFYENLLQIAEKNHLILASLQPYLMGVYNSCIKQLSRLNGYFAIVEANKLVLLKLHQGQLQSLHTNVVGNNLQEELMQILVRESMLNEKNYKEVLIYAPANKNVIKIEGWQVTHVKEVYRQHMIDSHFTMLRV